MTSRPWTRLGVLRLTVLLRDMHEAFMKRFKKAEALSEVLELEE
jgi:hypothetical protein